ncbi:hypothetical protein TELCIR_13213 [Teladorsagia circumcincta]|uniref:Uncharacterized protein n=1 Tax=Teladorsagia circumcincta TaxID=45464 RepID=A0A2G9U6G4_TELCI|nr:hypothetical protein TELCIR_13213 [Teladorsagia circumcincta]
MVSTAICCHAEQLILFGTATETTSAAEATAKSSTVNREVIGVFAWAAVMMAFSGLGSWFGSHGIDSLVAIAAGKEGVTLMTYAILPMITMSTLLKYERSYFGYFADVTIRFMMLTSAIAQGVLIGSVLDTKHIQNEPLAFVTPITFAFIYAIVVESVGGQNSPVKIACAGSALFANYVGSGHICQYVLLESVVFVHALFHLTSAY